MLLTTSSQNLCCQLEIHQKWCRKNKTCESMPITRWSEYRWGTTVEKLFSYVTSIASRKKRDSLESQATYQSLLWNTVQCWSLAILKWGPVWQIIILADAAQLKGAQVQWQCPLQSHQCRGMENPLGVSGAKLDDMQCWHRNKLLRVEISSFLATASHLFRTA